MRGCLVRLAKSLGVWVGVSVVVMVGLGVCLSVEHWDWLNQDGDPSATIRNAGLVVAAPVALVLAAWRSVVAERQSETAEKNLINEQFKSGVELLGHRNITVRLGGVSTLSEMTRLYPEASYERVMDLFVAFLTYPPEFGSDKGAHKKGEVDYGSRDTLEILKVISLRTSEQRERRKIFLRDDAPFAVNGKGNVVPNIDHEEWAKWRLAREEEGED